VLSTMGISEVSIPEGALLTTYRAAAAIGIMGGLWFASVPWLISIATLLFLGEQSLAIAFGTYFIFQHSASGWDHLKKGASMVACSDVHARLAFHPWCHSVVFGDFPI
jgi:hypothetical protein